MKRVSFSKWLGFPLILVLLFTLIPTPFLLASITSDSTGELTSLNWSRMSGTKGWRFNSLTPQPASPEYLIITPNSSWVQNLAMWKNQKGVPTLVANITWITTQIPINPPTVRDKPEQIWTYINQVYNASFPSAPTLQWVLLIGDNSTLPPRYTYHPETFEWLSISSVTKPTDFYYAVMDDHDWDDDNDGLWGECFFLNDGNPAPTPSDEIGDWDPDLYVGRIPFSDQGNITAIIDRTLQYSKNPTAFSATGWETFLLAGAISNYEEEFNNWNDPSYPDWTTEAELSDRIDDDLIPGYYNRFRFYEQHPFYFWNYTPTNSYQFLNTTAVYQGINAFSPALMNFAGHGSPTDIQRKYTNLGYPYGGRYSVTGAGFNHNVTGVAIGDPDNDGFNEIVYTNGPRNSGTNGTIWFADGLNFQAISMIWDLWRSPIPMVGPTWATCVDIGDVWNNGTISVVVGTWAGAAIIFTFWNNVQWNWFVAVNEPGDPILCIEVGNADNAHHPPGPYGGPDYWRVNMTQTDIAWGHISGIVIVATVFGSPLPPLVLFSNVATMFQAVYSIDVGNPNDDMWNEVTYGTGYISGTLTGDCNMSQYIPGNPVWNHFLVDQNVGGIIYGLDSGDAANDGFSKVVLGLSTGAIFMYEANKFSGGTDAGTKQIVANHGANRGIVRCLRVGDVDNNDIPATTTIVENTSIIVGVAQGGIRKYHADNNTGYIDEYPIEQYDISGIMSTVTAIDVGELSYTTTQTEIGSNIEIASGTNYSLIGLSFVNWYEWPWNIWDNFLNTSQVLAGTASIPALIYADSCLTGAFDYPQLSLAGAFMQKGSIGYIGSMRVCWYYYGPMSHSFTWGGSRWLSYNYWDLFFGGTTNYRPGSTLFESKRLYNSTFWPTYSPTWVQYWEEWHRKNLLTIALFGDPEVEIYTHNPGTLTATYPMGVPHNQNVTILVQNGTNPVAGALVCLWDSSGTYYERSTTNGSGYVIFNVTAPGTHVLEVTITKHNFIPHIGNIAVAEWLTVSDPTLTYDTANLLLDITDITVTCPVHSTIDDLNAITYSYTIYQGTTNITSGNLSWDSGSSTWQALDVSTTGLAENTYWVRIYFADSDGIGWQDSSSTFIVEHHLSITLAIISYDSTTDLVDITSVTATCSYSNHGALDDTEATTHTYTIYDASTDTATGLSDDLSWSGSHWQALDVDVSSLASGDYYVITTFADSDVSATQSGASGVFTIPGTTTPTTPTTPTTSTPPPIPGFPLLAICVGLVLAITMVFILRRRPEGKR
jgi:hypothetical protein